MNTPAGNQGGLKQRATHATLWSTLEIASRYGVQVLVTITLARLLRPRDFGLIAMLLVFTSLGAILVNSGFGTALIQRRETSADDETTVLVFAFSASLILFVALWFSAPAIAFFYHQPALTDLARLVIWILPIGAFAVVPDTLLTKRLDFSTRTKVELVASVLSGGAAVYMAWRGYGVWAMGWQIVLASILRTSLLWVASRWKPEGRFTRASFKRLFSFGSFLVLAQLLDTTFIRIQSLLLGRFFDAATLGYYALAQNAQQAPTSIIGSILSRVGLPVFSEVADQPATLSKALRLSMQASLFIFLPCMIGLALAAKPVIIMVYGNSWTKSAPILTLLALSAAAWPMHVLNLAAMTARGRSDLLLRNELLKKLISISLVIVSSAFGPIAVASSVLLSSLFGIFVNTWYSGKYLGYGLVAQLLDQRSTVTSCLLAAPAAWAVLHWTRAGMLPTIAAIAFASTIYLGAAVIFCNPALDTLAHMARTSWGRTSSIRQ